MPPDPSYRPFAELEPFTPEWLDANPIQAPQPISTRDLTLPSPPDPVGSPFLASLGYGPPNPCQTGRKRRVRLS